MSDTPLTPEQRAERLCAELKMCASPEGDAIAAAIRDAVAAERNRCVETLRHGTLTLPPELRNPQGFAVLEWAVAAIRSLEG